MLAPFAGAIEECGCTWTSGSSARRSKRRRVTRLVLVRSHFCTCAGSRVARYSPCLFGVQSRRSGARFGVQRSSPLRSISPIRISPIRRSACKSRTSPRRSISPIAVYSPRLFGVDPVRVDRTKAEVLSSPIRRAKPAFDRYRLFDVQSRKERSSSHLLAYASSIRAALAHQDTCACKPDCARGVRANDRIVFRKCMSVQDVFSCTCKA